MLFQGWWPFSIFEIIIQRIVVLKLTCSRAPVALAPSWPQTNDPLKKEEAKPTSQMDSILRFFTDTEVCQKYHLTSSSAKHSLRKSHVKVG